MNHKSKTFENLLSSLKNEEIHIEEVNLADIKKRSSGFKREIKIRNIEEFVVLPMFTLAYILYSLTKSDLPSMLFSFAFVSALVMTQILLYINYKKTKVLSFDLSVNEYNQFEKTHMLERLSILKKLRFIFYGYSPLVSISEALYKYNILEYVGKRELMLLVLHIVLTVIIVMIVFNFLEEKINDLKKEISYI